MATIIVERTPTLDEYLDLVDAVGWSQYVSAQTAKIGLENSIYAVVAEQEGSAVGMARVVGDGALFLYVQDVSVLPGCQGHGVGGAVMKHLMSWLGRNAPERAFLGLFSARGEAPFYERYGFQTMDQDRPGLYQHVGFPAHAAAQHVSGPRSSRPVVSPRARPDRLP